MAKNNNNNANRTEFADEMGVNSNKETSNTNNAKTTNCK